MSFVTADKSSQIESVPKQMGFRSCAQAGEEELLGIERPAVTAAAA